MDGLAVGTVAQFLEELSLQSAEKEGTSLLKQNARPQHQQPQHQPIDEGNSELANVLQKVEEDIQNIKREILSSLTDGKTASPGKLDYNRVQNLFEAAERRIVKEKEGAISKFSNTANTLSSQHVIQETQNRRAVVDQSMADERAALIQNLQQKVGPGMPSPGKQALALQKLKSIINPGRVDNRKVLNQSYGVGLPVETGRETSKPPRSPVTGSTIPNMNLHRKRMSPAKITEEDARQGIRSLIEKQLVPAGSHLNIEPSPVKQAPARLHAPIVPYQRNLDLAASRPKYNMSLVKFDDSIIAKAVANEVKKKQDIKQNGDAFLPSRNGNPFLNSAIYDHSDTYLAPVPTQIGMELVPLPTPLQLQQKEPPELTLPGTSHKFVIQNGVVQTTSQDFLHFKNYYCLSWGSILGFLNRLEKLMMDYSIPIAFVDGDKLADLALYFEVGCPPSIKDLLLSLINGSDVEKIIMIPGRRYMAADGQEMAAIKIQATFRCHTHYSQYLQYRRKKWAAGIIALSWIMCCKMTMMKKQLRERRILHHRNYKDQLKHLADNWSRIQSSKRVIIHIPSLGYSTDTRELFDNINIIQNLQIGRICDIKDPNVSVVYICPLHLSEELKLYYERLVEVMASVCDIDPEELNSRLTIVTPEHINSFQSHNLCLSTLLKYSSRTLNRLKKMIAGKPAYIIPGLVHQDDLDVSNVLGLPICGSDPEVAQIYSTKSGAKRIFHAANVDAPPGLHDIYSINELHESLARLVAGNLHIKRWLFKIDNEFNSKGIAYVDVTAHLSCHEFAVKEAARYGDKWQQRWAQDPTFLLIYKEIGSIIEQHATVVDSQAYPSFEKFLDSFFRHGGLIEACPPADSVTSLTANALIEPSGDVKILSVTDQIHSKSEYHCWGHSLPQCSVEQTVINGIINKIAAAGKQRGIIGYICVDFVTFIDPELMSQVIWAVDMNLQYSRSLAMVNMVSFLTDGMLDAEKNTLKAYVLKNPPRLNVAYQSKRKKQPDQTPILEQLDRCAVFSSNMIHSNMNNIHYNVFFQMCKAKGIGYDSKLKMGTAFTLIDSVYKDRIGMVSIGESLPSTLTSFMNNMLTIHDEISAPTMPGVNNFQGAIHDIKTILNITDINSELDQSQINTLEQSNMEKNRSSSAKASHSFSEVERTVSKPRVIKSANTADSETRIPSENSDRASKLLVSGTPAMLQAHKIPTAAASVSGGSLAEDVSEGHELGGDEGVDLYERRLYPTPATRMSAHETADR